MIDTNALSGVHRRPWHWISLGIVIFVAALAFFVLVLRYYAAIVRAQANGVQTGFFTEDKNFSKNSKQVVGPQRQVELGAHATAGNTKDPRVTIVQFADFECPYSSRMAPVMRWVESQYGGQVKIVFRHFPVATIHERAARAAEAAACADAQGKFWPYHDLLFQNQQQLNDADLRAYAQRARLDLAAFDSCLKDGSKRQQILTDVQDGLNAGVGGTPTFFVNGFKVQGYLSSGAWVEVLKRVL